MFGSGAYKIERKKRTSPGHKNGNVQGQKIEMSLLKLSSFSCIVATRIRDLPAASHALNFLINWYLSSCIIHFVLTGAALTVFCDDTVFW